MGESKSLFEIVDDTLHEVGLPAPRDILPSPKEVATMIGLPLPGDITSKLKADIKRRVEMYGRR